jgi:glycosyltransferase involved in cell wall biosynthesis
MPRVRALPEVQVPPISPVISIPESERKTIQKALAATGGRRGKAARRLSDWAHHSVPEDETIRNRVTIALDATYSLGDALSGVGIYSREILRGLADAHPETCFDWCYRAHRYRESRSEPVGANVRRRLLLEPIWPRGLDLFHGLNQRLPRIPMRRAVATFHDLFVLTGEYSTEEFRARFAAQARDAAARADAIITVSAFTKQQVLQLLGVGASKVHVVHHGIRPLVLPEVERENVILNVGAIQKRKNIARLVEAFEGIGADWRLVLAGSNGYGAEGILDRIAQSPARDRIHVTGYLSPEALAGWYARARIFAFPSLDEGFGMPVLEAMAAGVPVIASNRAALPEVVGDAAVSVDAEDVAGLSAALRAVVENRDWAQKLTARGKAQARLFSWGEAVRKTWEVYRTLTC